MNLLSRFFIALLGAVVPAAIAHGHGHPVLVAASDSLVVSGGQEDSFGYAEHVFVENNSDGDPRFPAPVPLPPCSSCEVWDVPGFEITGMRENSKLRIEVLPRPANDANLPGDRWLWYWDPLTESVSDTPASATLYLRAAGNQSIALDSATTEAAPIQIAEPVAMDMNRHNHDLLFYALTASPSAPAGAYGFFARLTSDEYASSDPFLVVIDHMDHLSDSPDYAQIVPAALAINAAAFLPGDYNHDDVVDAADYTAWRDTLGSETELAADGSGNRVVDAADYDLWADHFGESVTSAAGAASWRAAPGNSDVVPEPASILLLLCLATWATTGCRGRAAPAKTFRKAT